MEKPLMTTNIDTLNSDLSPTERLGALLKRSKEDDDSSFSRLFIQMDELHSFNAEDGSIDYIWKQVARWVRFEETVEGQGERWSKPHVSTVSLKAIIDLRRMILEGAILLDADADKLEIIIKEMTNAVSDLGLSDIECDIIKTCMTRNHQHQYLHKKDQSVFSVFLGSGKSESKTDSAMSTPKTSPTLSRKNQSDNNNTLDRDGANTPLMQRKANKQFMRKLADGTEAANVLIGEIPNLSRPFLVIMKLCNAELLQGFTEVHVNTRFLFLLLGPSRQHYDKQYYHIGRCWATLLCDEMFHEVAYHAQTASDLVNGLDEFLEAVTLLPPSNWDPKMRIDPPPKNPPTRRRVRLPHVPTRELLYDNSEEHVIVQDGPRPSTVSQIDPGLIRTGRLFGGLMCDIRRKVPYYLSDFRDALHPQCLASFVFLYFAAFTPIITFGGLLGLGTNNYMATMECILAGSVCGILFSLFSGQPLNILGPTGPMLVLEVIIYNYSTDHGFNYLSFRVWIGLWTSMFLVVLVALDLSALVRYITRFTEEAFACLISTIFIYDAISKLIHIHDNNPVGIHGVREYDMHLDCHCGPPLSLYNNTLNMTIVQQPSSASVNWSSYHHNECIEKGGALIGAACEIIPPVPDVFLFSILLFAATFLCCYTLHNFRGSSFFPASFRNITSDFTVFIAIVLVTGLDWIVDIRTPKLKAPEEFHPTKQEARGWFINPVQDNPWWLALAAAIPALLATILIFMDQQITAVIVNRKENKLKKGTGYHLDMFVMAIVIAICSILGLPWFVASTVVAITHVTSLNCKSECTAPGERPQFVGIREQRLTGLSAHLMIGLSVFFTPLLKHVPMPVLYGVFMFMGVSSLHQIQFVRRLLLMLMPHKYQPDLEYLRHVPTRRVHMYTGIQLLSFAALWVVKKVQIISITFPLMVLALCIVRYMVMEKIFTTEELRLLDSVLPAKKPQVRRNIPKVKINDQYNDIAEQSVDSKCETDECIPMNDVEEYFPPKTNMTEEIEKTGLWLHSNKDRTRSDTPVTFKKESVDLTMEDKHNNHLDV